MVYITGDMHGEQRLNDVIEFSKRNKDVTSLIILGDFGGIWKNVVAVILQRSSGLLRRPQSRRTWRWKKHLPLPCPA